MGKCTETFLIKSYLSNSCDQFLDMKYSTNLSSSMFNTFIFPCVIFFNYYTILCLFLILILPTVHAVLWEFYIMLHRLGYHWGPTCYFTLSTWCVSTVQVSCTWILMKQWQFKPQEVKKKKKTCTRQLLDTQHALCMTNQWILLCSSACWGNVNLCVCGLCLLLLGHEIHVTERHVSVVSIAGKNLGVGDNRDRYEPSLC